MMYGNVVNGRLVVAGPALKRSDGSYVWNPSDAQRRAAGQKLVSDAPSPLPPPGKRYVKRWTETETEAVPEWRLEDAPAPTLDDFDKAMEEHLRQEREERGYTTREPDAYLTSAVPRWSTDAMDWVAHRDAVMTYALTLINAVEAGEREPPTVEEFKAGLPRIEWTAERAG